MDSRGCGAGPTQRQGAAHLIRPPPSRWNRPLNSAGLRCAGNSTTGSRLLPVTGGRLRPLRPCAIQPFVAKACRQAQPASSMFCANIRSTTSPSWPNWIAGHALREAFTRMSIRVKGVNRLHSKVGDGQPLAQSPANIAQDFLPCAGPLRRTSASRSGPRPMSAAKNRPWPPARRNFAGQLARPMPFCGPVTMAVLRFDGNSSCGRSS